MWDLLSSLVRVFLLVRDAFGYLIPGTVLLGSIVYVHGFGWAKQSWPGGPEWLAIVVAVIGCYVAGQVLVALGYIVLDGLAALLRRSKAPPAAKQADILFYRQVYPELFYELDRRGTINILRIGLAVALIVDGWLLSAPLSYGALVLGLLMLWNGYTGRQHVAAFAVQTVAAAEEAMKNKVPFASRK